MRKLASRAMAQAVSHSSVTEEVDVRFHVWYVFEKEILKKIFSIT
jgi:hypothetical protein